MTDIITYWHTLRHLRPVQFYGRFWFRLMRPKPDLRPAPLLREQSGCWQLSARRKPSMLAPGCFYFLGKTAALGATGWDNPEFDKLWRYNQHYFDDLNAIGANQRASWHHDLLMRWVKDNIPGQGTGWEPYPVSLRIVNWIKWALAGNTLAPQCLHSLAVQVRWLGQRLEKHLLGNHLFVNAKALVFAGLFFNGPEAYQWFEKGFRLLAREVPEQILADGGQFERSSMYHALALEDMLDLCNLTRTYRSSIPESWDAWMAQLLEMVGRMRIWLAAMCHPDQEISFFNDAAIGIAPSPAELEAYALRIGFSQLIGVPNGVIHLADSGYIRVQGGPMVALLDVAPVGPDYLPGHAHADTLSFELSLFGQRFLVNSGTSCYGVGDERMRQRGTAAHNTVVVDGKDSSEIWGGFRVARRARPMGLQISQHDAIIVISCAHDGYRWLEGKPRHTRKWQFTGQELIIEDRISGNFNQATARFHLHPSVKVGEINLSGVSMMELQLPTSQKVFISIEGGLLRQEVSSWHPEFGQSELTYCLSAEFKSSLLYTSIRWENAF